MNLKKIISIGLIILILGGCISSKSYVDPKYNLTSYSDINKVENEYESNVEIEFQRNGEHLPAVDGELRSNVERILRASGVIEPVADEKDIRIKVICNNIADIAAARAKGFGAGLTFGAAGTAVTDYYEVIIELQLGDETIKKNFDHAIHTTIGNKAAPVEGVEPTSLGNAFSGVIEDVILQFIKEMQESNILTLNDLFLRNKA